MTPLTLNNTTGAITASSSVSIGGTFNVGVTAPAWGGGFANTSNFVGGAIASTGATDFRLFANMYYDGGSYKAVATGASTMMLLGGGGFDFFTAASVSAGAAVTLSNKLSIANSGAITASSSVTMPYLSISTGSNTLANINSSNATGGYIAWQTNGTTIADIGTATQIFGSGGSEVFAINGRGARAIAFGTNNTQRLTIASDGAITASSSVTANSFVKSGGTSSQFLKADGSVDGSTYLTSAGVGNGTLTLNVSGSGLSGSQSFTANQSGNATFTVTSNATTAATASTIAYRDGSGNLTAVGFFESSDRRLKNIISRDGDVAYFKWKDGSDNKTHIGYIAQEVQKKNPDQVKADDKGFLSVNYTEVLVEKVRALEKKIEELEKRMK